MNFNVEMRVYAVKNGKKESILTILVLLKLIDSIFLKWWRLQKSFSMIMLSIN